MREVCHDIEPVPQPKPHINPGGDCFACATAAAVGWCAPEKGIPSIETVHDWFAGQDVNGNKVLANVWPTVQKALSRARYEYDYPIEHRTWILSPRFDPKMWAHNWFWYEPESDYTEHLEAFFSAGWVAYTSIRYAGDGQFGPECGMRVPDHDVLLDGTRISWVPTESGTGSTLRHEIHVVCSARGAYWVRTQDLLRKYGAAGCVLVRRDEH